MNIPEELPRGWVKTTLGEITAPARERVLPTEAPDSKYIGLEHIEPQTMKLLGYKYAREVRSSSMRFSRGDVLYGKMRPYLNKVWVADFDGLCSAEFLVFPKSSALVSRFLAFRLNADDFVIFANRHVSGERPRVDFDKLSYFSILLPPINEQRRIATKLKAAISRIDRGESAARRAAERLQRYRTAALRAAISGELTSDWRASRQEIQQSDNDTGQVLLEQLLTKRRELWEKSQLDHFRAVGKVPKDDRWKSRYREPVLPKVDSNFLILPKTWTWASIDQLSWDSGYGTSLKCTYDAKGPAVVRIPNIKGRKLDFGDLKFAVSTHGLTRDHFLEPGDFLLVRTNGSKDLIGRAAVVKARLEQRSSFASYLIRFRLLGDEVLWSWLTIAWDSPLVREWIEAKAATTAGQYNVSLSNIAEIAVPLPPLSEQSELAHEVERRFSAADRLRAVLEEQLVRSRATRQTLLDEAFTGRLVPQHPRDRDASSALERIRASRKDSVTRKRGSQMARSKSSRVLTRRSLLEVLREQEKPLTPEQLFMESGYQHEFESSESRQEIVDSFYEELRQLVGPQGPVAEERPNKSTVLLRVK